jgi:hypothetical protein
VGVIGNMPLAVRVHLQGAAYGRLGRIRQSSLLVDVRVHPHRLAAVDDDDRNHRLVRIAGDKKLLTRTCHDQHRNLDRQRASAGREERLVGPDSVGHQVLGLLKDAL